MTWEPLKTLENWCDIIVHDPEVRAFEVLWDIDLIWYLMEPYAIRKARKVMLKCQWVSGKSLSGDRGVAHKCSMSEEEGEIRPGNNWCDFFTGHKLG